MDIITKIYAANTNNLLDILGVGGTEVNFESIYKLIISAIKLATALAGIVGFVMFIYASILYVLSMGDDSKAETAKKTIIWSLIGLAVVAAATFIVNFVDRSLS